MKSKTTINNIAPLLEMVNINLKQENIPLLKNINLDIKRSEVHALVGEHGSGKSSIGLIISGLLRPNSGKILFEDNVYPYYDINRLKKQKISMVYQQIQLLDYFTVAENLLIPNKIRHSFPFFLNRNYFFHDAQVILDDFGFKIDPHLLIKDLQLSEKMVINILRNIYRKPDLLILDSVLEKLAANDLDIMKGILLKLKEDGMSMLFITNKIDDIYDFADRVTIMRNGEILLTDTVRNIDRINLIKLCYAQITRSQNAENLNQEFYQMLKYNEAILQKLPLNLIVSDKNNQVKMINDFGKSYFHLDSSSYMNINLDELFGKGNKEVFKIIKSTLSEKQERAFFSIPFTIKHAKTVVNIKVFPIFDGAFLIGNIIIIEDISTQEGLRQQVILSEKLASVGLLAAGVAHEINNPLEIIYNYLNYLKFNTNKEAVQTTVSSLEEEIASIKQIVGNLISFSDNNKIINEDFNLDELMQSLLNLIKYNAKHKDIFLRYQPFDNMIFIRANKNEIKQVILNIIKNSFEAMPGGGVITIETNRQTAAAGSHISAEIIIRDTGPGIKDENLNNIFMPFYSTKKGTGQNLGLGLSVSYGIIKKYNGEIQIRNLKGVGCEFIVSLPINENK